MSTDLANDDPIFVDLDGTLITSDMLWESLVQLARRDPRALLRLPGWLSRGRATLKAEVASRVRIDPASLPYRQEVLDYLATECGRGRRSVLTTGSDERFAREIAEHLGIFDAVLASSEGVNNTGSAKLDGIRAEVGNGGFEYLGNAGVDVEIWRGAARATLVAPSAAARRGAAGLDVPQQILVDAGRILVPALRSLRAYQWVKNLLLLLPILLAHELHSATRLASVALAFATFCCVASATYILNDLLDIEADRQHPRKRRRPFAAGTLPIPTGVGLLGSLLVLGFGISLAFLPLPATGMLAFYALLTTAYSFRFKERLFVDVLVLAGLYTHRVLAGGVAAQVPVSPWLLAFSLFFFLSLAFVKRYSELLAARANEREGLARRGYRVDDIGLVESMGLTSGYMSILVLCLYISGADVSRLYAHPEILWLAIPVLLFWMTRMWFLARRGEMTDDPVLFAATDRATYLCAILIAGAGGVAALLQ